MPAPNTATFERPDLGAAYESFDHLSLMNGLVGLRVLRPFKVAAAAGNFSVVPPTEYHRDAAAVKRAPGAGYHRDELRFGQQAWNCEERGAEELLDDRERAAYGYTGIRFDQIGADRSVAKVLRNLEIEVAGLVQDSSGLSGQATGAGTAWTTHASATPLKNLLAARTSFRNLNGVYPNALVIEDRALVEMEQCAEYLDRVKYTQGPKDQSEMAGLAALLKVDEIIVAASTRNTAGLGLSPTFAGIWNPAIVSLVRVARSDDLREMTTGRTFMLEDLVIDEYRDESRRSDVVRARIDVQPNRIQPSLIWMVTGCV
ncbi:MAG: hypothetical protein KF878_09825 [Planctomycetes bacterium]|nr:hypothetical protein [Planctomycetota bacterium]